MFADVRRDQFDASRAGEEDHDAGGDAAEGDGDGGVSVDDGVLADEEDFSGRFAQASEHEMLPS